MTTLGLTGPALLARVTELIRDVPDFPTPGVGFKDITPVLADAAAFSAVVAEMAARVDGPVDLVVGMEARGFMFAAPVAVALGAGFVPVRKAGKLPGPTVSREYSLEYGTATVELHPADIPAGSRVLVVDDVLATGGTAAATVELLEGCGAEVVGLTFLVDLEFLGGRARLPGRRVEALLGVS
ncbi:adenine phosphoribosyltransferase [Cellulomonas cellasea]|uniref:Adenine phosphoribosyltransferase n=1 Tax=Cellulomonas cellasea TaxID=43670 RepID=A0A7W4YA92_9CELL|nr:adenine phosphoribosyltransferase [Cellulomonas cellasea]MBB2921834.1 adenine phosphoribosyltransferase [Cellulomonas cellasea]